MSQTHDRSDALPLQAGDAASAADPAPVTDPASSATGFAYEADGHRVPAERFYAIACDPRRSVAVEACAGAGKTWMLVSRILRALLEGVPPHEILAITFTKKAAGEMRQRLQDWLREFSASDDTRLRQELRLRGLPEARAAELAPQLRGLYARLLAGGRPVQIRTFHSWFAALLRTAPLATLEALGLPARGELLEDDAQAIARVWRPFQALVAQNPGARRDYADSVAAYGRSNTGDALEAALAKRVEFDLADAQGRVVSSVARWETMFADLLPAGSVGSAHGVQADDAKQLDDADHDADDLQHDLGDAATDAADLPTPAGPESLLLAGPVREQLAAAARLLGASTVKSCIEGAGRVERGLTELNLAIVIQGLLTDKFQPRKFSEKLVGLAEVRAAQALAQRLHAADIQHQAWLHHGRMTRLTRILLRTYADLKREEGWVDMNDVERAALELLSDPVLSGWVQERLDARVSQLLVDEFQDTNPLQWQALHAWLSGYAGAGGGQAPAVFIVGDPKQSIYRFRRAEPQVFRAAQTFIVDGLGGARLGCDHTRRNAPQVLAAVNTAMLAAQDANEYQGYRNHTTASEAVGRVLAFPPVPRDRDGATAEGEVQTGTETGAEPGSETGAEPGPEAQGKAKAVPKASQADAPRWRDSLLEPRHAPEEKLLALECRQAAAWLADRIAGGLAPGQVMVLARKRERLVAMEEALRALGIPAQQPDKRELGEAPEVQDLVALIDVLVSPTHDLSLARALKSPIFGARDDDLAALALRARAERPPRTLDEEGRSVAGPAPAWLDMLLASQWPQPALAEAAARLAVWRRWVQALPPHDALDAICHDGQVLARYAAATPAVDRAGVLARLRALFQAALEVSGGRYLTPYAFVRALRAGGQLAPTVAAEGAVQLLTVHGAKGLEAKLVLLLDTDGGAPRAETMGVLVDWPGEEAAPLRFVFLASESRPPACCVDLLAREKLARANEELNTLYVAMTRAREELVLSSVEPYQAAPRSWWRRMEQQCELLTLTLNPPVPMRALAQESPIHLQVVPSLTEALDITSGLAAAVHGGTLPEAPRSADTSAQVSQTEDSLRTRFGEAMHRLLEGVPLGEVPSPGEGWPAGLLQRVAREFGLGAGALADAVAMADRILGGEGAWCWDPAQVDWADNEVPLHVGGALRRIDRLVRTRIDGTWWVLDYKSAARPEDDPELRAQLTQYRDAVAAAHPGEPVRAAFLTGTGRLVALQ